VIDWTIIGKGVLAAAALLTVAASARNDPPSVYPPTGEQIASAVLTFLSVIVLHWLAWRFIIPVRHTSAASNTSFLPSASSPYRSSFYRGTIGFGYLMVLNYCAELAGLFANDWRGHMTFLTTGLFLIGLGTAARRRDAFAALESRR
jgi:hypothetical protein